MSNGLRCFRYIDRDRRWSIQRILRIIKNVTSIIAINLNNWRTGEYVYNAVHKNEAIQQYSGTYDIKCIAIREIGNALGIPSETNERSIMYNGQNVLATFDSLYPSGLLHGQATKSYSDANYGANKTYSRDANGEVNSYIRNNF